VATPSRYLCLMLALVPSADAAPRPFPLKPLDAAPGQQVGAQSDGNLSRGRRNAARKPHVVIFDVGARQKSEPCAGRGCETSRPRLVTAPHC